MATSTIKRSAAIERMTVTSGASMAANESKEIFIDISTLKSQYNIVEFLNFNGANGSNYAHFGFNYAYNTGDKCCVNVINNSIASQTLASITVSFLCM